MLFTRCCCSLFAFWFLVWVAAFRFQLPVTSYQFAGCSCWQLAARHSLHFSFNYSSLKSCHNANTQQRRRQQSVFNELSPTHLHSPKLTQTHTHTDKTWKATLEKGKLWWANPRAWSKPTSCQTFWAIPHHLQTLRIASHRSKLLLKLISE